MLTKATHHICRYTEHTLLITFPQGPATGFFQSVSTVNLIGQRQQTFTLTLLWLRLQEAPKGRQHCVRKEACYTRKARFTQ